MSVSTRVHRTRSGFYTDVNRRVRNTGIQLAPITPISPIGLGPSSVASGDGQGKKKTNPLTDLVETEKVYVDLLTGIIRVRLRDGCGKGASDANGYGTESGFCMVATEFASTRAGQDVPGY